MKTHFYKVMTGDIDGHTWINDQRVPVGSHVELTQDAAKYLQLAGIIGFHPLDRDRNGRLGGAPRPPSVADIAVPAAAKRRRRGRGQQ